VDYIGIANELKQALKTYTDAKGRGEPTLRAGDFLLFSGFNFLSNYAKHKILILLT
jgi:type I site-specific restriction-modification system R (restriction) subunit